MRRRSSVTDVLGGRNPRENGGDIRGRSRGAGFGSGCCQDEPVSAPRHKGRPRCGSLSARERGFLDTCDRVAEKHRDDTKAELDAHLEWIGEWVGRPHYRGRPEIHAAAELPEQDHPARKVAAEHKREMRRRLKGIADRLGVARLDELAGQLSALVKGAFSSLIHDDRRTPARKQK